MYSYSSFSSVEAPSVSPFTSDDELELDSNIDNYEADLPGCSDDNNNCQADRTTEKTVEGANNCEVDSHGNSEDNCPPHSSSDNLPSESGLTTVQRTKEAVNQVLTICEVIQ